MPRSAYLTHAQAEERERLAFGRPYDPESYSFGGISHFETMSADIARKLIDKGYMDPHDSQNDSPTNAEFVSFVEDRTEPGNWFLRGYVVSPNRDDCRINIEGVGAYCEVSAEELVDFLTAFRFADELTAGADTSPYCWYD